MTHEQELHRRCQQAESMLAKLNAADGKSARIAVRDAEIDRLRDLLTSRDAQLRALVEMWRERERVLLRRADAQGSTLYADRLAAEAEGIARSADQLLALLDTPPEDR